MAQSPPRHDTEAKPINRWRNGRPKAIAWKATCSCGWEDRERPTKSAAEDDCYAHVMAEIPDDTEGSIHH